MGESLFISSCDALKPDLEGLHRCKSPHCTMHPFYLFLFLPVEYALPEQSERRVLNGGES